MLWTFVKFPPLIHPLCFSLHPQGLRQRHGRQFGHRPLTLPRAGAGHIRPANGEREEGCCAGVGKAKGQRGAIERGCKPGAQQPRPKPTDAAVGQFVGPVAEDSTLHPRRSSWGMSKHSYWTIRSASYGTGTSEEEFTRSNWMAVSGQSPGNRWCPLRWPLPKASHTPSDYKLACGRYTTPSWTVDGIPDLPPKLRHKKAGHLLIKTPQLRGTGMSASCVKIEEKTQKAAPSKLK